jgi:hypothetical protein
VSDTATTDAPDKDAPDTPERSEERSDHTVPVSELRKERRARKELEDRLAAFESEAEERRKAEMSEVERHKAEAEELRQKIAGFEAREVRDEKRGWVLAAAKRHDDFVVAPEDVADLLAGRLDDIDDKQAAAQAVKELKADRPHLVGKRTERPDLRKVLDGGERVDDRQVDDKDRPPKYTMDELKAMSPEQASADLDEVNRSLAHWSQ